jgi:hypothetical protein
MRGLSESTKQLIRYAYRLLEAVHPQTLRQLHYAIFSLAVILYANEADIPRVATGRGRRESGAGGLHPTRVDDR